MTHIGPARRLWMGPQFSFRKRDIISMQLRPLHPIFTGQNFLNFFFSNSLGILIISESVKNIVPVKKYDVPSIFVYFTLLNCTANNFHFQNTTFLQE